MKISGNTSYDFENSHDNKENALRCIEKLYSAIKANRLSSVSLSFCSKDEFEPIDTNDFIVW